MSGLINPYIRVPRIPIPPGPYDRLLPGAADLNAYTTPFPAIYGNIIVRIFARNGAATTPTIAATWNGVPMTQVALITNPTIGSAIATAFVIRGGATGVRNLAITVTGGSAGVAAVRIGELQALSVAWQGAVDGNYMDQVGGQYYGEVTCQAQAPGNSDMATVVGWADPRAFAIDVSYPDSEQWSTSQGIVGTGIAARFGRGTSPGGESGGDLFVWYSANQIARNFAGLVFELKGAVLPP